MKNIITLILAATCGTIAIELNKYLVEINLDNNIALIVSSVCAAFLYLILIYVLTEMPLLFYRTRKFLDKRAEFEGIYIESFLNLKERPTSITMITYNHSKKSYSYSGRAYNKNNSLAATWEAFDLNINSGEKIIQYFFNANIIEDSITSVRGHGVLEFNTMTGYFVDSGSNLKEYHHTIKQITKKELNQIIHKKKLKYDNEDDWERILMYYKNKK